MKILMLAVYSAPEKAASSYLWDNLKEDIVKANNSIELFAPTPTRGVSREIRKKYKKIKHEVQLNGKLKIYRFSMFPELKNPLLRALRYFCCHIAHFYKGLNTTNIDVIFIGSTPPTQGAMAALLKKAKNIPIIYCLQDVFPDSLVGTGLTQQGSLLWKIGRIIEDFTYRNADKIIVISDDMKKNIMAKGVPESKIEVIYNWVDENAVQPVAPQDNKLFEEFRLNRDDFHVVYAGNLGHVQNIELIINAAHVLRNYTDLKFIIFGTGGHEKELRISADQLKLKNLFFFPLQPADRISEVYSLGNISIVSCQPGLGRCILPSKTWSIMSAGTAVLASFDEGTELQRIVKENRAGLFCQAGDFDAFAGAILKLYRSPELCEEFGQNGRRFVLNNLTRDFGTSQYIKVIMSAVTP
jgi:glycosyltransferase involved in cell wall biosynthesis